ncbi:rhomboid family intramembrane serine protease [Marinilongibacter aquaticus]|uniref:rhomboid family intramembrane serine protease n=1 Tax=Marinilongibacter aquaticus TaxID=2975157 RepID=UPI0021BD268E|nr:rhomboid family intramembrane serine protease [Marinilongibacter aquaticus]UBM57458.1 rhomboid family intramembrane serine protease [Marinilongibacter aquaticus]
MFDRITPMVKNLLIVNGVVFLLSNFAEQFFFSQFAFFNPILPGSDQLINPNFKIWQVITYMFMHGGIGHIFSNMFGLFIFGPALESYMGSKKFLTYYLITGVGAAVLNSVLNTYEMSQLTVDSAAYWRQAVIPMVGASGAIFGILVAFGVLFPNVELFLLFFPIPIKAKYFVVLYGLYELYAGTAGIQQGVAHFAHIGGLITGYILLKFFGFDRRFGGNFRSW